MLVERDLSNPLAKTELRRATLRQMERMRDIHRYLARYTGTAGSDTFRVTEKFLADRLKVSEEQIRRDLIWLSEFIKTHGQKTTPA